jgi:hypothetical protein
MKNNIYILLGLIAIVSFNSCEIDDICVENVLTPKLIIKFYDADNTTSNKSVEKLSVWAENHDKLYTEQATDSIAIPLDLNFNHTKYLLSNNLVVDTLYIFHNNTDVFVSRSCGYKINFELTDETTSTNYWISSFETTNIPQLIKNEQEVHLKIYH